MSVLSLLCYLCLAVFLAAVVVRALKLLRLPLHLRWELYPVAHEKGRAHYGGSYLEDLEWWTKPRASSKLGELKVMAPEILFLEGVRHHNLSQWWRTWPFHFGLYLLIGATVLCFVGGILGIQGPGGFFGTLIPIFGYAGLGLSLLGAIALLVRRLSEAAYREYSRVADFFNLGFFTVALALALVAHLGADPGFLRIRAFFGGLVSFQPVEVPPIQAVAIALFAILTAYVPLTHMSHFFTKYFMYHDIRWSDEPLVRRDGPQAREEDAENPPDEARPGRRDHIRRRRREDLGGSSPRPICPEPKRGRGAVMSEEARQGRGHLEALGESAALRG